MWVSELNQWLTECVNAFVGKSAIVDTLVALPMRNELVKAVPVLACLIAVWHSGTDEQKLERRKWLLLAIVAATFSAGFSRLLSESNSLPRPYTFQSQVYRLDGDELVAQPVTARRVPQDGSSMARQESLSQGNIPPNDFGSFPSDHAALFFTLACGILAASRPVGALAMAWTCGMILFPKVWTGMHTPLDILGGCAIGVTTLWCATWLVRRLPAASSYVVRGTLKFDGLGTALLFVFLFEAGSTFEHAVALMRGFARFL